MLFAASTSAEDSRISLPQALPGGEKGFTETPSVEFRAEYSDGTEISVFEFDNESTAIQTVEMLSNSGVAVNLPVGDMLSGAGAFFSAPYNCMVLTFHCGKYLVRVISKPGQLTPDEMVKTGEMVLAGYFDKEIKHYSTPEQLMQSFLKAVAADDEKRVMECFKMPAGDARKDFESGFSEKFSRKVTGNSWSRNGKCKTSVTKTIMEREDKAAVRLDIYLENPEWGMPEVIWTDWNTFLGALIEIGPAAGRSMELQEFWVPATRVGKVWKIDVDELKERSFYPTKDDYVREKNLNECRNNLQRLGNWFQRRFQSNAKMPDTLEKLAGESGIGLRLACPACAPVPENSATFVTNYVYESYFIPLSKLNSKTVLVYCGSAAHKKKQDGRMVLFANGNVRWVAEDVFTNLLKESRRLGRDNEVTRKIRAGEKVELTDDESAQIRRVISNLSSDDWKERNAAREKLLEIGARSYEILKEYENAEDLETRRQVRELMKYFK
jgi:hypothetical protein